MVETLTPFSLANVVHRVVSVTLSYVGITILFLLKSTLLNIIPVLGAAGKVLIQLIFLYVNQHL